MAFVYEQTVDSEAPNDTHAHLLAMVGYNKFVLELGCATGYFSKALVDRGCTVVGLEIDPEAASIAEKWTERALVGDIDRGEMWNELDDDSFDVVLCGDVLEHLRDPLSALRAAVGKLKPSGTVVASVPNIAHGDVRLALLRGSFRYQDLGLLDRTHIRFFTLETVRELFRDAGLLTIETERIVKPLFQSELGVEREGIPQVTIDEILRDPEAETYQFVIKAVRDNGSQAVSNLAGRVTELSDHIHHEEVREILLRRELHETALHHQRAFDARSTELEERTVLLGQVADLHRHIEAMNGHVAGLDQIIAHLNQALAESEQRFQRPAPSSSMGRLAPLRRTYGAARRMLSRTSPRGS